MSEDATNLVHGTAWQAASGARPFFWRQFDPNRPLLASFSLSLMLLTLGPSLALEPWSFHCLVTDFIDDSRYPSGDDVAARNGAIAISIIDEGDRLVVETLIPGSAIDTRRLPVIKRTEDEVVGEIVGEQWSYSLALKLPEQPGIAAAGSLIHRTYEVDHRWLFRCAG